MEIVNEIVTSYYWPILIVAILSLLALIGYLVENHSHKDFQVGKREQRKVIDNTDMANINITENKGLSEMIGKGDVMSALNDNNPESLN